MSEPAETSPHALTDTTGATEKRWPAIFALVTAWIVPATTTRRTNHVRLISAWGVHMLAFLAAALALLIVCGTDNRMYYEPGLSLMGTSRAVVHDLIRDAKRYPIEYLLGTLGVFISVEGGIIVLAVLLMPWSAKDERLASTFKHSLRRIWLHCGPVALLIFVIGMVIVEINYATSAWFDERRPMYYEGPPIPSRPITPEQLAEYDRLQTAQWQERLDIIYSDLLPLSVKYRNEIGVHSILIAAAWLVWSLLRGLAANRPTQSPRRSPLCRLCGYSLTGLPPEGRCPECGRPMPQSIGAQASPGAPWEHSAKMGYRRSYLLTLRTWARDPATAAMRLRLEPESAVHGSFLLVNLALAAGLFAVGVAASFWVGLYLKDGSLHRELITVWPVMCAAIWAAALLLIASLAAWIAAIFTIARDRRNSLCIATQVAFYCSGWLTTWTSILTLTLPVCVLWFDDSLEPLANSIGARGPALLAAGMMTVAILGLIPFAVRVYRASAGVRYACR